VSTVKNLCLKKTTLLILWLFLVACHKPTKLETPRDFTKLDALLLEGEPRRQEAQEELTDQASFSHVISLLAQYEAPGEAATLAWNAHHALLGLGEPALLSLQERQDKTPMERFTEARLLRRMGLQEAPPSDFYEAFCRGTRRGAVLLRYESGREEAGGRLSLQIDGEGRARLSIKHIIKPFFSRSFTLSEIELSFLFDRVCASYFWEDFPRREQGAAGEEGVFFSISLTPEEQSSSEELVVWEGEWRVGPTERLAKMLDATVARGKQTSLLLP
jgi:hypothetical protein